MNSLTGIPFRTCTFLKASSTITGCPAAVVWTVAGSAMTSSNKAAIIYLASSKSFFPSSLVAELIEQRFIRQNTAVFEYPRPSADRHLVRWNQAHTFTLLIHGLV